MVIARELNEDKVPTWTESYKGEEGKGRWRSNSIIALARNEFYTGDSLYQKTFMENYKKCVNTGQLDQYLNEADHPAIIDHDTFRRANEAIREHAETSSPAVGNYDSDRTETAFCIRRPTEVNSDILSVRFFMLFCRCSLRAVGQAAARQSIYICFFTVGTTDSGCNRSRYIHPSAGSPSGFQFTCVIHIIG